MAALLAAALLLRVAEALALHIGVAVNWAVCFNRLKQISN